MRKPRRDQSRLRLCAGARGRWQSLVLLVLPMPRLSLDRYLGRHRLPRPAALRVFWEKFSLDRPFTTGAFGFEVYCQNPANSELLDLHELYLESDGNLVSHQNAASLEGSVRPLCVKSCFTPADEPMKRSLSIFILAGSLRNVRSICDQQFHHRDSPMVEGGTHQGCVATLVDI